MYSFHVTDAALTKPMTTDRWIQKFLAHLATDRGASVYTQRNYRQALQEFFHWHQLESPVSEVQSPKSTPMVAWEMLQRDDFRGYLRFWAGRIWAVRRSNSGSARCGRFTSF